MILKGIRKGDHSYRHFTFDDEKPILKNGVYYYEVKYPKNPLEGEMAEEEIGYVRADDVMCLGGKKPKPLPTEEHKEKIEVPQFKPTENEPVISEPKKRGRPKKVTEITDSVQTLKNTDKSNGEIFEYCVTEFRTEDIKSFTSQLNEAGHQGWELCGFDSNKSLFGEIHMIVIFKRKRG